MAALLAETFVAAVLAAVAFAGVACLTDDPFLAAAGGFDSVDFGSPLESVAMYCDAGRFRMVNVA